MARKTSALAVIFLWFIALPASAQEADMAEYPKIPVASSSEQSRRLLGQELSPSLMEKLEHGKTLRQNMALRSLRGILGDSGSKAAVNNINFSQFRDGDIVFMRSKECTLPVPCYWQHVAIYDSLYDEKVPNPKVFWTAYKGKAGSPDGDINGVGRQSKRSVQSYYLVHAVRVRSLDKETSRKVLDYIKQFEGRPYNISSPKWSTDSWYCSKVVWKAYKDAADMDLDTDGGYYALPDDIYMNFQLKLFAFGEAR